MPQLRIIVLVTLLIQQLTSFACQCPLTALSTEECDKYQIIYRGRITSLIPCSDKKGEAMFEVLELYKGQIQASFKVIFDCETECAQTFNVGEEWIIYTNYKQVDNAKMDWCSRSRKYFKNEKLDFYTVTYGNSYDEELTFLREKLGTFKVLAPKDESEIGPHNILPNRTQTIITLLISLVALVLFLFLFKKFFKYK